MFDSIENAVNQGYEVFDGCFATVVGRCRKGAYLTLDNGEEAFAWKFANLPFGSTVLCTVLKMAQEGKRMLVSIDSVVQYPAIA